MKNKLQTLGLTGAAVLPAIFVLIFLAYIFGFLNLEEGVSGALVIGASIIITVFLYMQSKNSAAALEMKTRIEVEEIQAKIKSEEVQARIKTEEMQLAAKVKAEEIAQKVGELRGENAFLKDTNRDLQNMVNDMEPDYNLGKAYRERATK